MNFPSLTNDEQRDAHRQQARVAEDEAGHVERRQLPASIIIIY